MKITKQHLCDLFRCYAVGFTVTDGTPSLLTATEGEGPCFAYSLPGLRQATVWDGPGGTMSIVPVPKKNGDFLAVQRFFPTFQSENAEIVWSRKNKSGGWETTTLLKLPYVHRFDILSRGGVNYLFAATLCTSKTEKDDWSDPGKLYAGVLPDDLTQPIRLEVIKEGLTKNHGYWHEPRKGYSVGLVSSASGVLRAVPPAGCGGAWVLETLLERPVSDIALCDIDGDGENELITIEPFHGSEFLISKKIGGNWQTIYRHPKKMDFCHVAWGGMLRGVPTVIGGCRREKKELFYIQFVGGVFVAKTIDAGTGPSNVAVLNGPERDIILTANREIGEAAVYWAED